MELDDNSHGQSSHPSNQDVSIVTGLVGEDGVMVLKLIGTNSSELLVRDIVCGISRMARGGASVSPGQVLQQDHSVPTAPPGVTVHPIIQPEKGEL